MKRSSQALLSKSIAESKGKLHPFSRGPRRKVCACVLCTSIFLQHTITIPVYVAIYVCQNEVMLLQFYRMMMEEWMKNMMMLGFRYTIFT